MKKSTNLWSLVGFAVTSFGGTLLHFLYDLTGKSPFIAPFSGVNESTWEHMKLIFFPMLLFAVIQSFFFRDYKCFWCIKLRGTLTGLILIPVLFYTYNGVLGRSPDWINIAIFFISALIAYIHEAQLFKKEKSECSLPRLCLVMLLIIAVLFVVFTFFTPEIAIFKDPITGTYGI